MKKTIIVIDWSANHIQLVLHQDTRYIVILYCYLQVQSSLLQCSKTMYNTNVFNKFNNKGDPRKKISVTCTGSRNRGRTPIKMGKNTSLTDEVSKQGYFLGASCILLMLCTWTRYSKSRYTCIFATLFILNNTNFKLFGKCNESR